MADEVKDVKATTNTAATVPATPVAAKKQHKSKKNGGCACGQTKAN